VCFALWAQRGLGVVAVQETHLGLMDSGAVMAAHAANAAHAVKYQPYFSYSRDGGRAGVAIFVARRLLADGRLRVAGDPYLGGADTLLSGRVAALPLDWGGHRLLVAAVYAPNQGQGDFLRRLLPVLADRAGARRVVLLGDFNFVDSPALDRLRPPGAADPAARTPGDRQGPPVLQSLAPHLVDVYRALHPAGRAMTWWHAHLGGARLDRVYADGQLRRYFAACATPEGTPSDHRAVVLVLTPAAQVRRTTRGAGLPRHRMLFWEQAPLRGEFGAWMGAAVERAPPGDQALLQWWPRFKAEAATELARLNRLAARREAPVQTGARQAAAHRLAAAAARVDNGDPTALAEATAARAEWAAAARAEARERRGAVAAAPDWLHPGEQPSPVITAAMRAPRAVALVPALRSLTGDLLPPGPRQAQAMVQHLAGVSSAAAPEPAALQAVLAAMAGGPRLDEAAAAPLEEVEITVAEVAAALKRARPGKAPGPDGLPVEVYRRAGACLRPLLARLFTAVGRVQRLPTGFLHGAVTCLYKAGDAADPANYRPITLLNTDYRLWAKVLANRLLPVAAEVVSPSQTAFLKGRSIGDNVHLLQLAPHVLAAERRAALVAFLDIRKAYDTLSRPFLAAVLGAAGLGGHFRGLVSLMLGDTQACAVVNGYVSQPVGFAAGVRQGCPLAPLLYLFAGEALHRFLRVRGHGIRLAGGLVVAAQFADDTQVFLEAPPDVPRLLESLRVYQGASGQAVSAPKSSLLQVGHLAAGSPLGDQVGGVPVVASATALGVAFATGTAAASPKGGWQEVVGGVLGALGRLARLPLSRFGLAAGAAAYALSKALYAAEYCGLPPPQQLGQLQRAAAALVDRKQAPADGARRFAGIRGDLLALQPEAGGFGALPLVEHTQARHAKWAVRLVLGSPAPWVRCARWLLARDWPWVGAFGRGPGWHPLALLAGGTERGPGAPLPPPLERLVAALRSLPLVRDVSQVPLQPGPQLAHVPITGNPLFVTGGGDGTQFMDFAASGVRSVGDVWRLEQALAAAPRQPWHASYVQHVQGPMLGGSQWFPTRERLEDRLAVLAAALPAEWRQPSVAQLAAAPAAFSNAAQLEAAADGLLGRMGWRLRPRGVVPLAGLTVRRATGMLLMPARAALWARHMDVCRAAAPDDPGGALVGLRAALKAVWRLRWRNDRKELLWRFLLNALPTAERLHQLEPCQCGSAPPGPLLVGREHHFWACPVAERVVTELQRQLGFAAAPLERGNIWLLSPPLGVHPGVWQVVALCALHAMWRGRRVLSAGRGAPLGGEPSSGLAAAGLVGRASAAGVAHFWDMLAEFCSLGREPPAWRRFLGAQHPFLRYPARAGTLQPVRVG
jgi:exonuclease III